ncbi:exosortase-associated protein EpsI, V-type [Sphingomonas flavescens]|uniref:exosortase-associated protein EpsI, V-type n=1 Tax=Sphingomonas flavescens TaxID=3132797 RepID=UPI002805A95C|nr:exosortase-associated protein EpsI, V-type [Sphingomonas limnosediminicola]
MKPALDKFVQPEMNRRKFMVGLLLCSAAGVAAARQPRERIDYLGKAKLDKLVPEQIGRWKFVTSSGLVVPPQDQLAQAIYAQQLTRVYSDGEGPPIMLLLAQNGSQTGFLQIHRPETCYTAGGYQISPLKRHPINVGSKVIPANSMEADLEGRTEHIVYWTRVGSRIPPSWRDQKLAVAIQNLEGIIPDAILIRISAVSDDGPTAYAAIDEFTKAMIAAVPSQMQRVFTA